MSTVVSETSKGEMLKVEFRRVIRASRERVFAAWTKPEEILKWFGPGMIHAAEAEMDARAGGAYRLVMKGSADGKDPERRMSVCGAYTAVIPNELICFTWRPTWNTEDESLVTVRLRDVEGGTELVLIHERIASEGSCSGYNQGWTSTLEKLEGYLQN